jgi:hypothetical protein
LRLAASDHASLAFVCANGAALKNSVLRPTTARARAHRIDDFFAEYHPAELREQRVDPVPLASPGPLGWRRAQPGAGFQNPSTGALPWPSGSEFLLELRRERAATGAEFQELRLARFQQLRDLPRQGACKKRVTFPALSVKSPGGTGRPEFLLL